MQGNRFKAFSPHELTFRRSPRPMLRYHVGMGLLPKPQVHRRSRALPPPAFRYVAVVEGDVDVVVEVEVRGFAQWKTFLDGER